MDLVAVLSGISGAVLVWASLKNKNPLEAVKLALSGGDPNSAPPFTAATDAPVGTGPAIDPNAPPGPMNPAVPGLAGDPRALGK